jgi:spermidine dehydrogenase
MTDRITRRDFLNGSLIGSGAALMSAGCPVHAFAKAVAGGDFTGPGGVGDYARSNGNTADVMQAAHRMRDGAYDKLLRQAGEAEEDYDLIIVGGGLCGLMAAYEIAKATNGSKRCLILENHPIFGGAAKQNEVVVDGVRLIGPQASNDFLPPEPGSGTQLDHLFDELAIPRRYDFQSWPDSLKGLRFAADNYENMDGIGESGVDVAYWFGKQGWKTNIWSDDLARTPYSERVRRDLLAWRRTTGQDGQEDPHVLDGMTYKHYLETVKGYDPEVTRFAEGVVALLGGVGSDAVSARVGHAYVRAGDKPALAFPGGNSMLGRYLAHALVPAALPGGTDFAGIANGRIDFAALDKPGQPTRIRLESTVLRVQHDPSGRSVAIAYERGGKVHRARAAALVMATGGWVTKHVVADLPGEIRDAYGSFLHAPALVVNVALRNWQFLYRLGAPAVRWMDEGMLGFCANIRRSMIVGDYAPPLHPDKPALLTFYMGHHGPGEDARAQSTAGRMTMLTTSYGDYERRLRAQMTEMFAGTGFDARRDIAAIILNRWGHARIVQPPGFYYGTDGKPSPREVVAKGFGRIAIAHSELNGAQNYTGAFQHGKRAAEQVLPLL